MVDPAAYSPGIDSMKMRKILVTMLAASTIFAGVSSNSAKVESDLGIEPVAAAKCGIPPLNQAYPAAKSVFVGKVISETQFERGKIFEFQVEKYWKGNKSKKTKVKIYETMRYQAFYEVGKRYLVFAKADDAGGLSDGKCSRSKIIAEAGEDLRALGTAKIPR